MTTGRTDKGRFAKGHSGNPNGRPPNCRALTAILETKGNATRQDIDGKRRAGKQIVGRAVWDLATTGRTQLQDGDEKRTLKVDGRTWFEIVKWIYAQVDGPPKAYHDVTTNDESLNAGIDEKQRDRAISELTNVLGAIVHQERD